MDKLQLLIILSIVSLVNSQFAFFLLDDGKNYNQTWQDQNCIPPTSVTFYKIIDIDGYYRIGDFVQPNYDKIGTFEGWQKPYGPAIAIRQYEENGQHMIIQLSDVEKVWDSVTANYKADTNITIWRPISPDSDYVVLGDIATQGYNVKPDMSSLVAVHKSCVTTCQLGPLLWSSYTSLNADVYGLESPSHDGLLGTFFTVVSQDGFDGETSSTYPCLKMSCLNDNVPQQVHLAASTDISTFRISWSTKSLTKSLLTYGTDPSSLGHTVQGSSYKYTDLGLLRLSQYFHQVKVTGLSPNTTYYYRVGDPLHGWSRTYAFTTLPLVTEELHCLVYGDLGYDNSRSLSLLKSEVTTGDYNFILHVGDFAYDMSDNNGLRGDNFMRMIEPLSASVPYHVCPGNHENAYNFSQYIHRFDNMPTEECGTNTPLYYSWDAGLVHFLSFSTEAYFTNPMEWGYIESQYNFLEADLIKANENRNKRPWIIMMGHRPLYCTDDSVTGIEEYTDCTIDAEILRVGPQGKYGIEQLFKKYGVDIYFTAHEHSYERLFPIYDGKVYGESYVNPKAPVHIIGGAAGNQEDLDGFGEKAPWDAFRSSSYGYGRLLVKNSTHLYWEQVGDINGQVIDSFVLIQENHGPFKF